MFKVDFNRLVSMLTPTILRRPVMMAWQKSLLASVRNLYGRFLERRNFDYFRESIDCTIPRLEFLLNTIFYPPGLSEDYKDRIIIKTLHSMIPVGIYLGGITQPEDENRPVYLIDGDNPVYLFTMEEILSMDVDFQIIIPKEAQPYDMARLRSLVRAFALPDKRYVIINL